MPVDLNSFLLAAVSGAIGIVGSYVANRQAANAARAVAFEEWRRDVQRQAYGAAERALRVGRRLYALKERPSVEEQIALSSEFVDPFISARIAFGLETNPETRFELIHAVASILHALNEGQDATPYRDELNRTATRHFAEITAAWQRTSQEVR